VQTLEKEIFSEIERLKDEPVTEQELNRAKNQVLAQVIYRQDSPSGVGYALAWWEIVGGGLQIINRYPEEIQIVTPEYIMDVARRYFNKDNRTVGYLLPQEER